MTNIDVDREAARKRVQDAEAQLEHVEAMVAEGRMNTEHLNAALEELAQARRAR